MLKPFLTLKKQKNKYNEGQPQLESPLATSTCATTIDVVLLSQLLCAYKAVAVVLIVCVLLFATICLIVGYKDRRKESKLLLTFHRLNLSVCRTKSLDSQ